MREKWCHRWALCYAMLCYEPMHMLIMLQGYKDIYLPVTFIYTCKFHSYSALTNRQNITVCMTGIPLSAVCSLDTLPVWAPSQSSGHSPTVGNITVSWTLSHCGQQHSLLDTLPMWATAQSPRHSPSVRSSTVSSTLSHYGQHHRSPGHSPSVGNNTVSWTLSQCAQHHSLLDTLQLSQHHSLLDSRCGQHHSLPRRSGTVISSSV